MRRRTRSARPSRSGRSTSGGESSYTGVGQLGQETEATPLDVPLHPGAGAVVSGAWVPVVGGGRAFACLRAGPSTGSGRTVRYTVSPVLSPPSCYDQTYACRIKYCRVFRTRRAVRLLRRPLIGFMVPMFCANEPLLRRQSIRL